MKLNTKRMILCAGGLLLSAGNALAAGNGTASAVPLQKNYEKDLLK